ncbi:peptidoglycan bridge formation glycyltransferase FemA/FemB family protein [Arenibacter sp. N53]|uniref:peptidoglycan bridge formation glycyltransferase FemA/FemB family protein n=1 Tax=Arenibacter TaxID=178469 RepID=UPI000CD3E1C5|nr:MULTISPECIES: peptidoglycan bridge formation glycyltransferase FemA/FemB family protein [Arenibacter]MCM4154268.1 peptidoglycan bridge formation glycyltransferase FemA/FemB family protein [Arenibacter sp. N53]
MPHITIVEKKVEWDALVHSFEHSDFYHTYDYHRIAKNKNDRAIIIKYTEQDRVIALPLLLRKIPGSTSMDATSVYGYAGPLSKNIDSNYDNINYRNLLHEFFLKMKIISIFSRLNPFIPLQDIVLKNLGEIFFSGKIVNIDLTKDLDTQKKHYNRRLKSYINKSRNQYSAKLSTTESEINAFIELYYENMRRVNATKGYFFDRDYFYDLLHCKDFKTEVLIAEHNESKKIIAGAMFIKKNNIVQYHLSGASEEYLHLNPIKMLIDEMRIMATKESYKFYNLGGGVGSSEDSLFRFKSGFSKDFKEFALWKYIVNEPKYEELTKRNLQKEGNLTNIGSNSFFPSYRYNNNA